MGLLSFGNDPDGTVLGVIGESVAGQVRQILWPWGAAVDTAGNVYVAEYGGSRVRVFAPDGTPLGRIGEFGFGPGQFISPLYLTVAPDGLLYVADGAPVVYDDALSSSIASIAAAISRRCWSREPVAARPRKTPSIWKPTCGAC